MGVSAERMYVRFQRRCKARRGAIFRDFSRTRDTEQGIPVFSS